MTTLAVAGATGHLGRLVLASLIERGAAPSDIVAIGRDVSKVADFAEQGVVVRPADYSRPATLDTALEGVDRLLLISGSEVGRRVAQHSNVVQAAKRAGVQFIAYTSAPHADTTSLALAPEHKATEELVRSSGIPFAILRNNWYTESYVQVAQQAKYTGLIIASLGDGRVASADRRDYAEGAAVVLAGEGHEGAVYEFSGDVAWGYEELARVISSIVEREVTYKRVSPREHRKILTKAGLDIGTAGFIVTLDTNTREGALADATDTLSSLIGRPTTPLAEGLAASYAESVAAQQGEVRD
ncbi:SDR family oxidoreductase [Salinibacterium sp. dk2585]|uniref:SDR family oxidoreductase n=1 Tax=unclassified Salinibacterium TaxID=2632331 RepID=UPI0011C256B0|nr:MULTISPECIES: SDR family oxidoreductase [unclassified Salinibacterium]QEE61484.1 SDR family oxidoreductase [Salinibacterium sp. dk2585]TXK54161.1 SDR family oxidoreductase [Salinibacterium sp. dk5596]